jgi:hypothetical protein
MATVIIVILNFTGSDIEVAFRIMEDYKRV